MTFKKTKFFLILYYLAGLPSGTGIWDPSVALANEKSTTNPWCESVQTEVRKLGWNIPACGKTPFVSGGTSVQGRTLAYWDFGNPESQNSTLILSMVHGDEITPLYVGLSLVEWLEKNSARFPHARVVIAPLVNPDGFLSSPRSRVNARGVDLNRNFTTQDWKKDALAAWKTKYRADRRRYPGSVPDSEPETLFQKKLLETVRPQKIISIHAPLGFLDYDGPNALSLSGFSTGYVKKCLELRARLKAVSSGFFPGSLGNFAGQEKGIPTLTLELPSADPKKAKAYWEQFLSGLETVVGFEVPGAGS